MNKIIVVGGGLAGLSTAALLSKQGKQVVLLEKMAQLGGRCIMTEKDGFRLNFGAHAVYGRDHSYLNTVLTQLGIELSWHSLDPLKVRYEQRDGRLTPPPTNFRGILLSGLLPRFLDKLSFISAVVTMMIGSSEVNDLSVIAWLERKPWQPAVKQFLLQLAGTNFFTKHPELLRADVFVDFYKRVFRSKYPVSYIQGGWGTLTDQLQTYLLQHNVEIIPKEGATKLLFDGNKIIGVGTRSKEYHADGVVLCIPPITLKKLVVGTPLETWIHPFMQEIPNTVVVYDVALQKRVRHDLSYIADASHRIFFTDPSLYDSSSAPEGGQLLQGIAYVSPEEAEQPEVLSLVIRDMEHLLDKHYKGWRETLMFKRVLEQVTIQVVPPFVEYNRLPSHSPVVQGCFFAGDWCDGKGSVSDIAFFSALQVASLIRE